MQKDCLFSRSGSQFKQTLAGAFAGLKRFWLPVTQPMGSMAHGYTWFAIHLRACACSSPVGVSSFFNALEITSHSLWMSRCWCFILLSVKAIQLVPHSEVYTCAACNRMSKRWQIASGTNVSKNPLCEDLMKRTWPSLALQSRPRRKTTSKTLRLRSPCRLCCIDLP